jgi:helicase MOV-10
MDVRFCLNRLPLRRMHAALQAGVADPRIFFPEKAQVSATGRFKALTTFNRLIGSNPPQMLAVAAILTLPAGNPPFVVFGP